MIVVPIKRTNMRKFIFALIATLACTFAVAQEQDVTKFLGIPVDGTKLAMIARLKTKGFTRADQYSDELEGQFNGYDVRVSVVTNGNKVWRIALIDDYSVNEIRIKQRYNRLCSQFEGNGKYDKPTFSTGCYYIPEDESVSSKISKDESAYEAFYYQLDEAGAKDFNRIVWFTIVEDIINSNYRIVMFYDNKKSMANGEDL